MRTVRNMLLNKDLIEDYQTKYNDIFTIANLID